MITKTPCDVGESTSFRHFREAYPDVRVQKVTFAYDVRKLQAIYQQLQDMKLALKYCQKHDVLKKDKFHLYKANCSRFCKCFCCCCSKNYEATEFYEQQVDELTQQFLDEREKSLKQPVGIVFVTFGSLNNSKEVYDSFKRSMLQCGYQPPMSSLSSILKPEKWEVIWLKCVYYLVSIA